MRARTYLGEFELMVLLVLLQLGDEAYGVPISRQLAKCRGKEASLGSVYAALFISAWFALPTAEGTAQKPVEH
jgi:PadR family transcriptional regulator